MNIISDHVKFFEGRVTLFEIVAVLTGLIRSHSINYYSKQNREYDQEYKQD